MWDCAGCQGSSPCIMTPRRNLCDPVHSKALWTLHHTASLHDHCQQGRLGADMLYIAYGCISQAADGALPGQCSLVSLAPGLIPCPCCLFGVGTGGCAHAGGACCPVCHDVLGAELVMLPCGHQLCCKCSMTLIDRALQSASPQVQSVLQSHSAYSLIALGSGPQLDIPTTV